MRADLVATWYDANQRYLTAALAEVRAALTPVAPSGQPAGTRSAPEDIAASMDTPPAADELCDAFGLSSFERSILLLCAGIELDSEIAAACAAAQGEPGRPWPTFGLALAVLPNPHWSALVPDRPLRHRRLIDVGNGPTLTDSPLHISERVLHYLAGLEQADERLTGLVHPVREAGTVLPSQEVSVDRLIAAWSRADHDAERWPLVQLCGADRVGKRAIVRVAAATLGWSVSVMDAGALPTSPREIEALARLWEREALLGATVLLLDCDAIDPADKERVRTVSRFVEHLQCASVVSTRDRWHLPGPSIALDVARPDLSERRLLWEQAMGPAMASVNGQMDALVAQFGLGADAIAAASSEALADEARGTPDLGQRLWHACRSQARPRVDNRAVRVECAATAEDLIVPDQLRETLRDMAAHVRQRVLVYDAWGFTGTGSRGLGVSALFAGPSGTGKTMAAEVLANELELDLYRIDLSQVVNKYIGETEKNLRHVFEAAEEGGAILLFDEADALFGKRSEVKDSHDRYANIEVSYLLQQMESYRGLAILTTNRKSALDTAFLRRIRFVLQFPFPDASHRAEIWRRIFPAATPTEGLDPDQLARLSVAGGSIRNIALYAAFLAADAGEPVRMGHVRHAARVEYTKLEKPLTDAELGGRTMNAARVELRVEQVVLDGVESADRLRVVGAMERELTRLLAERGVPEGLDSGRLPPQIDGGSFDVQPGSWPEAIGVQVATALYRGMSP